MGALLDVVFALLAAGRVRPRQARPLRPPALVVPTPWLVAGLVAVSVQTLTLLAVLVVAARLLWAVATDDMLLGLGLILGPVLLAGLGMGAGAVGWMVRVLRRLLAWDEAARTDLALLGAGGIVVGCWLAALGLGTPALAVLVPAVASAVVAVAPPAWRPLDRNPLLPGPPA